MKLFHVSLCYETPKGFSGKSYVATAGKDEADATENAIQRLLSEARFDRRFKIGRVVRSEAVYMGEQIHG